MDIIVQHISIIWNIIYDAFASQLTEGRIFSVSRIV